MKKSQVLISYLCYTGTLADPIVVKGFGPEQYVGCTGCPADSHVVIWLTTINGSGEILNDKGDVIGKVEIVPGEAAEQATKALKQKLADAGEGGVKEIKNVDFIHGEKAYRPTKTL